MNRIQKGRLAARSAFFVLFIFAPILDVFRLDLTQGHFILFGFDWTLGIDALKSAEAGPGDAAFSIIWRGFVPLVLVIGTGFWVAWRYGRLYCGWLCPHFSVVEMINGLMKRASGKPSLWDSKPLPGIQPDTAYWIPTLIAVLGFAFLWAVVLLTYLLPPAEIYANLFSGNLTRNQGLFIGVGTLALTVEFLLARHLFCRFACAVGLFQSLAWMANDRAMVVGFDHTRATACGPCANECDNACPMRLKPRTLKRKMFTCTECGECISACESVQRTNSSASLLKWVDDDCALPVITGRPGGQNNCFDSRRRLAVEPTQTPKVAS